MAKEDNTWLWVAGGVAALLLLKSKSTPAATATAVSVPGKTTTATSNPISSLITAVQNALSPTPAQSAPITQSDLPTISIDAPAYQGLPGGSIDVTNNNNGTSSFIDDSNLTFSTLAGIGRAPKRAKYHED